MRTEPIAPPAAAPRADFGLRRHLDRILADPVEREITPRAEFSWPHVLGSCLAGGILYAVLLYIFVWSA